MSAIHAWQGLALRAAAPSLPSSATAKAQRLERSLLEATRLVRTTQHQLQASRREVGRLSFALLAPHQPSSPLSTTTHHNLRPYPPPPTTSIAPILHNPIHSSPLSTTIHHNRHPYPPQPTIVIAPVHLHPP